MSIGFVASLRLQELSDLFAVNKRDFAFLDEGIQLAEQAANWLLYAQFCELFVQRSREKGQLAQGLELADKALLVLPELNLLLPRALIRYERSLIFMVLGDYELTISQLIELHPIFEQLGSPRQKIAIVRSLGVAFSKNQQPEQGLQYYHLAVEQCLAIGDLIGATYTKNNIAINLKNLNKPDQAEQILRQCLADLPSSGHDFALAGFSSNLALILDKRGLFAEAEVLHRQALEIAQNTSSLEGEVEFCLCFGRHWLLRQQPSEGLFLLQKSLQLAEQAQMKAKISETHFELAVAYKALQQLDLAYAHLEQGWILEKQVFNDTNAQRIQHLQIRFEVGQRQHEADLERGKRQELEVVNAELSKVNQENLDLLEQLSKQAREDGLTGLLNRRALDAALNAAFSAAVRHNLDLCFILFDLDHFKNVNDRFGHQIGDACLRQIADLLRSSARDSDILGRYGGEEFVIAFSHSSLEQSLVFANRWRELVEQYAWHDIHPELHLTISLGLAIYTNHKNYERLLASADTALYQAKNQGRNKVVVIES